MQQGALLTFSFQNWLVRNRGLPGLLKKICPYVFSNNGSISPELISVRHFVFTPDGHRVPRCPALQTWRRSERPMSVQPMTTSWVIGLAPTYAGN